MQIDKLAEQILFAKITNHYALTESFIDDLVNGADTNEILEKYFKSTKELTSLFENELKNKNNIIPKEQLYPLYKLYQRLLNKTPPIKGE